MLCVYLHVPDICVYLLPSPFLRLVHSSSPTSKNPPQPTRPPPPPPLLPVMVWIHGGGNMYGAGSLPKYNGTTLAGEGGVIIVSFNYRLGPLGQLSSPLIAAEDPTGTSLYTSLHTSLYTSLVFFRHHRCVCNECDIVYELGDALSHVYPV